MLFILLTQISRFKKVLLFIFHSTVACKVVRMEHTPIALKFKCILFWLFKIYNGCESLFDFFVLRFSIEFCLFSYKKQNLLQFLWLKSRLQLYEFDMGVKQ